MRKNIQYLCYLIVVLTVISATVGIFYSTDGVPFSVENIYGETVELYGDGIYKYDTYFTAGINKGTDAVMIFIALLFMILTAIRGKATRYKYIHVGILVSILYYSTCLSFGITFNSLFPIYVLLFSASLFAIIFILSELLMKDTISAELHEKHFKGTAIFILISGSSTLVWLQFIIPAVLTGAPMEHIGVYTTEPTFVLDLAIILPTYVGCAIALYRKSAIGYKLTPVLLTFLITIGIIVIGQTLFQASMGIVIPIQELLGLVISFAILGLIAIILNIRFLKHF
ncbi:hypothetical protein [Desulfuribacillus alkaliarsenatis]|uniref:Uncharacterized protein n=1 Tax=Desulfuribacillus alkaliarsenatis TaxID=766136 RepID=A0A1E5FYT3_9FIRM|nr:hypothetical protein [Desulfuribacillus alkaliarsenatis]OEF95698.1 hypothetical protein BHF68_11365 [Desulfuribacillus alkaliarsenatis]